MISGQTDDENPKSVLDGKYDVILHIKNNETQILTFTHPGMPGYFGLNSHGLTVSFVFIIIFLFCLLCFFPVWFIRFFFPQRIYYQSNSS